MPAKMAANGIRSGTEPRHVHWCLLCLVTWRAAFGFTL